MSDAEKSSGGGISRQELFRLAGVVGRRGSHVRRQASG